MPKQEQQADPALDVQIVYPGVPAPAATPASAGVVPANNGYVMPLVVQPSQSAQQGAAVVVIAVAAKKEEKKEKKSSSVFQRL